MAAATTSTNPIRPFVLTTSLLLIVAAMYLARVVVVPVVLSALLTFLLTPAVSWLQRWRVPRVAAAIGTGLLAFAFLGGILLTVAVQFRGLAADLPNHSEQINTKAQSIHRMISGDGMQGLTKLYDETMNTILPQRAPPTKVGRRPGRKGRR